MDGTGRTRSVTKVKLALYHTITNLTHRVTVPEMEGNPGAEPRVMTVKYPTVTILQIRDIHCKRE